MVEMEVMNDKERMIHCYDDMRPMFYDMFCCILSLINM